MMSEGPGPQLVARLKTLPDGSPVFIEHGGKRHYKIVFEVENAPTNAYAATFQLHPTYYDPVRTKRPDVDGKFRLETTTYGDYDVNVVLRTADGKEPSFRTSVRSALEKALEDRSNEAMQLAVRDISSH